MRVEREAVQEWHLCREDGGHNAGNRTVWWFLGLSGQWLILEQKWQSPSSSPLPGQIRGIWPLPELRPFLFTYEQDGKTKVWVHRSAWWLYPPWGCGDPLLPLFPTTVPGDIECKDYASWTVVKEQQQTEVVLPSACPVLGWGIWEVFRRTRKREMNCCYLLTSTPFSLGGILSKASSRRAGHGWTIR